MITTEYAKKTPCVRSGYCCKVRPCFYGEVKSPTDHSCKFLEVEREIAPGVPVYRCGKYEWIMANVPEAEWMIHPAFGGGCSSPLFNTDRNQIIRLIRNKAD
jgi:hypothetical protein